ncbi:MAG: FAD-binding oxidoreductase [bacterium]|nr:FAD-binding oxidoreductase [bacterium]
MKIEVLPKSDNRNGWLETLPQQPAANRAAGTICVDYAVVGGGYTGLAAARRLGELDPQARVALIDAERIGNNAAGRCSGFAIDQAHNIRARNFAGSLDAERRQIALNRAGQDYLRDIVTEQEIDCDWREEGKIHGAATERGRALAKAYSSNLDLLGADYRWIDAAGMKAITGTDFYVQGLHTPGTIQVQPAALVTGMARSMPENVTVYEDSPVTGIAHGPRHRLELADGTISCATLALANNGFAPQFGYYRKSLIPVATWASLSRRLEPDEVETLGGRAAWGIIPADPFGSTVRRTVDNRILVRNIYSYARRLNCEEAMRRRVRKAHRRSFANRFAMLPGVDLEYTWGGALALSRNAEPVFGELAEGVYGSFCHNGVGVARGTICGKLLAEMILGRESELLSYMLAAGRPDRLPPEPLLGWGVRSNFAIRRHRAGLEL